MKNFFLLICCLLTAPLSYAQQPELLNKYRYVYLPQLYYGKNQADIYGIRKVVADRLRESQVPLFLEENEIPLDGMKNPCLLLHGIVNNISSAKGPNFTDIKIVFFDCKNDTVMSLTAAAQVMQNLNDTRRSFGSATRSAMQSFEGYTYRFSGEDVAVGSTRSDFNDSDSIPWRAGKKLTWDDFKGAVPGDEPADALTYTTHQSTFQAMGIGNRFHVESEVVCCFIKTRSWVKDGMRTDYLLNHEQRHFDLAEVGAREFRKRLKTTNFTADNFQSEVQKITAEVDKKYKKMQEQYDKESNHSRIEEKQEEWNLKIDALLKSLEDYK